MTRRATIILSVVVFALLSLAASITSEGFLEADACTHYMYARFALHEHHYLVNIWGRPFCTALYAIPATLADRFGVRCMSLAVAVVIAFLAWAIARKQKLREPIPTLALIFTLAQPLLFLHSFSELTELPFAMLLGLAFLLYQSRQWFWFAVISSMLPLARPEGFGFLVLAAIALCARGRWKWIFIVPASIILWSAVGWKLNGSPPDYPWYLWLVRNWPYGEGSAYRTGSIWHFVLLMPAVISPLIFPALSIGIFRAVCKWRDSFADHDRQCALLIALIPLMILTGHSVLHALGRMSSSGEIRYMLIVAPFWSVLAAVGWDWMIRSRRKVQFAILAASVPLVVNGLFWRVLPLRDPDDWRRAKSAVAWIRSPEIHNSYPRVQAAHPAIAYFLGVSMTDSNQTVEWRRDFLEHPRVGVVVIWDSTYSMHNSDMKRIVSEQNLIDAGWVRLPVPRLDGPLLDNKATWRIYLSPRDINGKPTTISQ